jgi:hypothetical protein
MGPRLAALIDASPTFPVIEPRQRPTTIRALVSRAHVRRALAPRPGGLAVAEHAPDVVGTWSDLGSGLDHQAFRWAISSCASPLPERVRRGHPEAGLLRLLAGRLSIPLPEPRFADPARGVLAYPLLPGRPLLGRTPPAGSRDQLGCVLAEAARRRPGRRRGSG